ncbi:Carbon-nitrogen hydrolase [Halogranum amylolyticum]|uniref:Carbon-nitrogen hydrolase n=1 Tax=Halogranum amylolyticum TaxID=660520 RepID=A0A1H8MUC6_9EURY|nr:carbon-nitrogen hydrolase family protein [Halogranum amylolyticum]SEO21081.1 Carbon-nitrogen hydrolase [Halogranum amylolyticum]
MTQPRIAVCQFEPTVGDVDANLDRIERLAERLPAATAVAVFPELCVTGYDLDVVPSTKTTVPGPVTERVQTVARDTGVDLVVGLPEAAGDDVYNSLVYASGDGVEATYRKQRLWGEEATQFTAGSEATTVDTPLGRLGLLLCYDLNFPELAVDYGEADCDLLAVSAAWRRSFDRDWRLLCRARALDQTCYVVGSNHLGSQSGRHHAGESLIAGPRGDVVAKTTDGVPTASAAVVPEALDVARERNPVRQSRREGADASRR